MFRSVRHGASLEWWEVSKTGLQDRLFFLPSFLPSLPFWFILWAGERSEKAGQGERVYDSNSKPETAEPRRTAWVIKGADSPVVAP